MNGVDVWILHLHSDHRLKKVQGKKKQAAARDTLERESRQAKEAASQPAAAALDQEKGSLLQDVDEDVIF